MCLIYLFWLLGLIAVNATSVSRAGNENNPPPPPKKKFPVQCWAVRIVSPTGPYLLLVHGRGAGTRRLGHVRYRVSG